MSTSRAPIAKLGVIPVDTARGSSSTPLAIKFPAPLKSVPIPKYVTVLEDPEQAGKVIAAVLETLLPAIVNPAADLATDTLA